MMTNPHNANHKFSNNHWNDSLTADLLWSNVNFGEAVSDVMTPLTWSLLRIWRAQWAKLQNIPPFGNIGGRLYMNISYVASALAVTGKRKREIPAALGDMLHLPIPKEMEIPVVSISGLEKFASLTNLVREQLRWVSIIKTLPAFVAANPIWCRKTRQAILRATTKETLALVWEREIKARSIQAYLGVLSSAMRFSNYTSPVRQELTNLVGADDADAILSNLSGDAELLASLGFLVGIDKVARGEMTRDDYLENFGHRAQNEWELAVARPAEIPGWLDEKLAEFQQANVDPQTLIAKQREKFERAQARLQERFPEKAKRIRPRIGEVAYRGRLREAIRSEIVRVIWVMRTWALRAGELTRLGDDIFFLTIDEVVALLTGDATPMQSISARKETYSKYKSLPPYPTVIRGRFDPILWAADPNRSDEIFSASAPIQTTKSKSNLITGSAGSAGQIEGIVRVVENLAEGPQLKQGEILVTVLTDIGWTPLFPRASAIITDVGAALSHAAIVARELGIPAVVGCGNATRQLKTGDRVRVDGARGVVEVLDK